MPFLDKVLGLGLDPHDLRFEHLVVRAMVVFLATLLMIRMAGRRFLARRNSFDVLLGFILASTLSRAINGSAPFFGTLGAGFVVVALHRFLSYAACKVHSVGVCLKGRAEQLIVDGRLDSHVMARHHMNRHDLEEDLRLKAAVSDPAQVKLAHVERNGEISVERKPQITEIAVAEGVQTVRIVLEG